MPLRFAPFTLPNGASALIPADLELRLPDRSSLDPAQLHRLLYIPWRDSYLERVPAAYRDFFLAVLPYLGTRTTNVHVATCLPFVAELVAATPEPVDTTVVNVAFILHDSGWSQMTDEEVAGSLGVSGLALSGEAVSPKLRHAELGCALAERLLRNYPFQPPLTEAQRRMIFKAILYHDRPGELAKQGELPVSIKLVCDVDHQWSFTHENFWQDTLRKGVSPAEYVENLARDLDGYLVTEQGRKRARTQLQERRTEVAAWRKAVAA